MSTTLDTLALITTCLIGGLWLMGQRCRMARFDSDQTDTE